MSLDEPEPVDRLLTFPNGYSTLEYSWVKATMVSMSLRILFMPLQSTNNRNTDYFHRVANGRKRKITIMSLTDRGRVIEGNENLLRHATECYKELFGPSIGNVVSVNDDLWGRG